MPAWYGIRARQHVTSTTATIHQLAGTPIAAGPTATEARPSTPPTEAMTWVVPAATAWTVALPPEPVTVAMVGSPDRQVTVPVAPLGPKVAFTVALVPKPVSEIVVGLTATEVTAGGPLGSLPPQPPKNTRTVSQPHVAICREQ